MPELPDEVFIEVQKLCAKGDDFAVDDLFDEALVQYKAAWEMLPDPREMWSATLWLLGAIGDVHYLRGDFPAGKAALMDAMTCFEEAPENAFLRMRLGQCLFEMGELDTAAEWMGPAYTAEGESLFEDEDPKYLEFIQARLDTPGEK